MHCVFLRLFCYIAMCFNEDKEHVIYDSSIAYIKL
jgi:hypothetical protein